MHMQITATNIWIQAVWKEDYAPTRRQLCPGSWTAQTGVFTSVVHAGNFSMGILGHEVLTWLKIFSQCYFHKAPLRYESFYAE